MRSKVLGAKRAVNPALSAVIENVRYSWRFLLHTEGAGMRSKVLGAKRAVNPAPLPLKNYPIQYIQICIFRISGGSVAMAIKKEVLLLVN